MSNDLEQRVNEVLDTHLHNIYKYANTAVFIGEDINKVQNLLKELQAEIKRLKLGQLYPPTEDNLPKVGQKFIILHKDGSRGVCLLRVEGGYKESDGEDIKNIEWVIDRGYDKWLPLPDDFKMIFEEEGE